MATATVRILVDTDIFIDYFNTGAHTPLLESTRSRVYDSVVTRKELLVKRGLTASVRQAILNALAWRDSSSTPAAELSGD